MKKTLLSIVTASLLLAGTALAQTQTQTSSTTTWTNEQGTAIRTYSTTQKYNSYNDPQVKVTVGAVLPEKVTVYPLPSTVVVPQAETYSYSIVNNHPVVVERTTRKVIHSWD